MNDVNDCPRCGYSRKLCTACFATGSDDSVTSLMSYFCAAQVLQQGTAGLLPPQSPNFARSEIYKITLAVERSFPNEYKILGILGQEE